MINLINNHSLRYQACTHCRNLSRSPYPRHLLRSQRPTRRHHSLFRTSLLDLNLLEILGRLLQHSQHFSELILISALLVLRTLVAPFLLILACIWDPPSTFVLQLWHGLQTLVQLQNLLDQY